MQQAQQQMAASAQVVQPDVTASQAVLNWQPSSSLTMFDHV
jgi:hypothetical protein